MKRIFSIALLVAVLSGCNAVHYTATRGDVSLTPSKGKVVRQAEASGRAWTYLLTAISAHVDVSKKMGIKNGEKVANLKIHQQRTFGDLFIGAFIGIIALPNSYTLTGDVMESGQ